MEIEIVNYIKDARQHGLADQEIKQNLLDVGWDPGQVEDSFNYSKMSDAAPHRLAAAVEVAAPVMPPQQPTTTLQTGTKTAPSNQLNPNPHPAAVTAAPAFAFPLKPLEPLAYHGAGAAPAQQQPQPITTPKFDPQTGTALNAPSLSDQHFDQPKPGGKKWLLAVVGLAVLLVLAGGGYFAYAYFNPTPTKVWNGFLTSTNKSPTVTANFNYTYSDPGITQNGKNQSFTVTLDGSSYFDSSNTASPAGTINLTAGYQLSEAAGSLPQSASIKLQLLLLNKILYADLSNIPQIGQMAGQPITWVKVDTDALAKLASSSPYASSMNDQLLQQQQAQAKIQKDLADILKNKQIITAVKILGSDTISGTATYHLQNQLDKATLKQVFSTVFDDAYASSSLSQMAAAGAVRQVFASFIDKMTVDTFETWIGKKDSRLYQIKLDIKFPGLASWLNSAGGILGQASGNSRDAKRIADMRQMASALELFYNDHNGYPAGQAGAPVGISPSYIGTVPTAPAPSDGSCSDYYNTYWYVPTGTPTTNNGLLVYPSYEYTFCLGSAAGGYQPGIAKLAPSGISSGLPCNDKPENCTKQVDVQESAGTSQPQTPADLLMLITYSDYGKKQTLTAPSEAFDLVQYLQQEMSGQQSLMTPGLMPAQGTMGVQPPTMVPPSGMPGYGQAPYSSSGPPGMPAGVP